MLLNWNGGADLLDCVRSVKQMNYSALTVLVVDNGSTDESVRMLARDHPDITILANGRNLGYARGFNTGLTYAYDHGADYFLIMNNDTIIDRDALTELVRVAQSDPAIGFVTGKVYWHSKPGVLQSAGRCDDPDIMVGLHVGADEIDNGQYDQVRDYNFVDDVFLLVRRAVYETVGGYDPDFFLYYEETDWCARVRRAGFRIVYTPKSKIWHKGMVGGQNMPLSPQRIYFLQRNALLFMKKNASRPQWRHWCWHLTRTAPITILRYIKHGECAYVAAYCRAVLSGLVWLLRSRGSPLHLNPH